MGTVNKKKSPRVKAESHLNFMGGPGYFLSNPVKQLELAAASCFFGEPMYYHRDKAAPKVRGGEAPSHLSGAQLKSLRDTLEAMDPQEWRGLNPTELMVQAIDKALDFDLEETLALAANLRTNLHIRTTPQIILVRAAHHKSSKGTTLIREYGERIVLRADEPAVGLAYHISAYGKNKPVPNSLKRTWSKFLSAAKPYHLAKYRLEDHVVKLVDVCNLVHPTGDVIGQLMKGKLKNTETWEAIISKKGSNSAAWLEAIEHMGHMALLRNLRNFDKAGVPPKAYLKKLVEGAETGKQLPFRYFSAYKAVGDSSGPVKEAIEECMEQSMKSLPKFSGKTMFLCDNSGSAWGTTTSSMGTMHIAEIANLTGVLGAHLSEDGHVGVFGDRLKTEAISKKGSILEQVTKITERGMNDVGGSTENGIWLFWEKAINEKQHWDNVFVMSDMQAGHGGLYGIGNIGPYRWGNQAGGHPYIDVAKLVSTYRAEVNKNVNVFLIQVAGYQDTIIPEFYKRTYILGGWSEGIFRFAQQMSGLLDGSQNKQ